MASRYEVEVTIVSAKDLKNVNWLHGSVKPYAVVWVDPAAKSTTRVDEEGDTSPYWDQKLVISFDSPIEDSTLYIDIVNAKPGEGTKALIGSAKLRLRDVVDDAGYAARFEKKLELKRPSGRPHGKLDVVVSVRDSRYRSHDPYYAPPYGVPHSGSRNYPSEYPPSGYGRPHDAVPYAAPPSGYPGSAYGPPAPSYAVHGGYYGQQQQQGGYYGQQQQPAPVYEEKKKSKFGGMGTGLAVGAVAGALGGLALAEGFDKLEDHIADEAAERVEDDFEAGDYGGDDF